jgi:hypothetical protein
MQHPLHDDQPYCYLYIRSNGDYYRYDWLIITGKANY